MTTQTPDPGDLSTHRLFAPLVLLLTRSQLAYEAYLQQRVFLNALTLRRINLRIVRLLHLQAGWLPAVLVTDAARLLNHYECWLIHFDQHRRRRRPALGDAFIFPTIDPQHSYPRDAVDRIIDHARATARTTVQE